MTSCVNFGKSFENTCLNCGENQMLDIKHAKEIQKNGLDKNLAFE